jgi:hypothetical protein
MLIQLVSDHDRSIRVSIFSFSRFTVVSEFTGSVNSVFCESYGISALLCETE